MSKNNKSSKIGMNLIKSKKTYQMITKGSMMYCIS